MSVSGRHFHLVAAGYEADVASVGATLRRLTCPGRDVVVLPFGAEEERPGRTGPRPAHDDDRPATGLPVARRGAGRPHPHGPAARAVDSWFLEVPAERALQSDERRLPVAEVDVSGAFDFRRRRPVGDVVLDPSLTALRAGSDGLVRVRVTDADGQGSELVLDGRCRWVHVYSADLSTGAEHRAALAVEPMTCPPDAFRSGRDLIGLGPGAATTAGWTIRAVGGGGSAASD